MMFVIVFGLARYGAITGRAFWMCQLSLLLGKVYQTELYIAR